MRRRISVVAALLGAALMPTTQASAGTIDANLADGILTVNGTDQGDDVTVRCQGGEVTVNQTAPSGGPTACADLRRILVFTGGGSDHLSLGDVRRGAFDRLVATSVSGQDGEDALVGPEIGDDLIGGGGIDSLNGGLGPDLLTPGPGGGEAIGGKGHDTVSVAGDGDRKVSDARVRFVRADEVTTLGSIEVAAVTGGPEPT